MRWRAEKRAPSENSPKTFLVLPSLQRKRDEVDEELEMNRNPGLRLFTKTWPRKTGTDLNEEPFAPEGIIQRPLTATLEHPQILDAKFVGQIDMSLIRKEFLAISTLCRMPLSSLNRSIILRKPVRHRTALIERRRISPPLEKTKKQKKQETLSEDSWEDESLSSTSMSVSSTKRQSKLRPPVTSTAMTPSPNRTGRMPKTKARPAPVVPPPLPAASEINNNSKAISTKQLPVPCTTCGRPDLPERFHSHPPATPLRANTKKKLEVKIPIPTKNSVQKPVAIRYKSKLEPKTPEVMATSKEATMTTSSTKSDKTKGASSKGPPTLTCYICGREYGTASLPLHEPKCLQKWERKNKQLPPRMQKKRPEKPDVPLTKEEWNKFAWESAQAQLVPCPNCHRTFFPDRLEVHQRSCKEPQRGPVKSISLGQIPDASSPKNTLSHNVPGLVQCSHCGKMFGSRSIKIHEPQCIRKLQKEKQSPGRNTNEDKPSSAGRKPSMFPCYLCGRLFGATSIYIHEPQCLKKWEAENEKLPEEKRRPIPPKPDIKLTPDGKIDFVATEDANWQSHLDQLVPCQYCKRTFNPDRVEVHERSCKGPAT